MERGLYSLRYNALPGGAEPVARVRVVSGPVTILTAPGRSSTERVRRGQVVVLAAESPSVIEVGLEVEGQAAASEVSFALDLLDRGDGPAAVGAAPTPRSAPIPNAVGEPDRAGFEIQAHVSRVGDVRAAPNVWVAGPDLPLPIEGLAILPGPRCPDLEVQVLPASSGGLWSPWAVSGQFAGTRQRAEWLSGVRLRLSGAAAADLLIAAEALFLGAAVVRKEGAFVEFVSIDPLVGLRVDLRSRTVAPSPPRSLHQGRVQIFKARS